MKRWHCASKWPRRHTHPLNEAGVSNTPYIAPYNQSAWAQYTIQVPAREQVQERPQGRRNAHCRALPHSA